MNSRKLGSLVGLPIYTLSDGKKLGTVKDVIYDSQKDQVVALTTEDPGVFSPHRRVLPFERIKSLGDDAIMVDDDRAFVSEQSMPFVKRALRRNGQMHDKVLLTQSGTNLGTVVDVLIDDNTGHGIQYQVSGGLTQDIGKGRNYIEAPESANVGVDAVLVPDTTVAQFGAQEPGGMLGAYQSAKESGTAMGKKVSKYTQEQEINLSKGKTAGRDVRDNSGNLIVAKGETITDGVIEYAVAKDKMHDVAMAAGVGGALAGGTAARGGMEQTKGRLSDMWSNFTEYTRESMDRASRERAVTKQKNFLTGKISANDVRDLQGTIILRKGDVITPLALDTLTRQGMLEQIRVRGEEFEPETVDRTEPKVHLVVESAAEHEQHKTHI